MPGFLKYGHILKRMVFHNFVDSLVKQQEGLDTKYSAICFLAQPFLLNSRDFLILVFLLPIFFANSHAKQSSTIFNILRLKGVANKSAQLDADQLSQRQLLLSQLACFRFSSFRNWQ